MLAARARRPPRPLSRLNNSARFASIPSARPTPPDHDEPILPSRYDLILSILKANPSLRETKLYLQSFGPRAKPTTRAAQPSRDLICPPPTSTIAATAEKHASPTIHDPGVTHHALATAILNPIARRTALVKMQGPFSDRQLESIATGMAYLEKLGLTSVIVVDLDNWVRGEPHEKHAIMEEANRVVAALERQGARARPLLQSIVRLGPKPGDPDSPLVPEAHTFPDDLVPIRSALCAGEIPVLAPLALDSLCRSVRVHSNDVLSALARGMVEVAAAATTSWDTMDEKDDNQDDVDLTPLRLMIINKEGGVPSYARNGLPHLLVNLTAEYTHINETFHASWHASHPTALANLALARTCLAYMPPSSSAIMVSHRSPKSLIGNLVTNRSELSSSLPHALLQGQSGAVGKKLTPDTPTILRRGLPVRVVNRASELDRAKLAALLQDSFCRTLDAEGYYERLEKHLDFAIIAGDYAGAAIVTKEKLVYEEEEEEPIAYLDKFAVRPEHQGDGTVDFVWVALHDESYGLGLSNAANPNGGKEGRGEGRDLVWRSRMDNPVNRWYFQRSTGHLRLGTTGQEKKWIMFWCDAEKRLKVEEGRRGRGGLSKVEEWERGRLARWARTIEAIPSSWSA